MSRWQCLLMSQEGGALNLPVDRHTDIPNFLVFVPLDGNTPPTVPANFYWARRTKWRAHVEFDLSEATKPIVAVKAWGRGAASVGFNADNPSFAYGWCGATNVTATGCDLDTYQYEIRECSGPSCAPGQVVGVFPATAALHVEYSFLGFPDVATSIGSEDAVDGISAPLTLTVVAGSASERALVKLGLGGAAITRVAVYNVAGRRVRTLHDGTMPRGLHEISWGLTDEHGARAIGVVPRLCIGRHRAEIREAGSPTLKNETPSMGRDPRMDPAPAAWPYITDPRSPSLVMGVDAWLERRY